eukprot:TRINITY_DN1079_c0_g1_i4.p1 TRINITY_DN1079_c0_g1~~TRINITY_DN1079_c0_g1_i4.p1  ORF type:complete len:348 (-),score=77.51 TRINITY_DN1079_c0_g1_i4:22-1065(-)
MQAVVSTQSTGDPDFYSRIEKAFGHLEKEARRGRIQFYGVSSSHLGLPLQHPRNILLEYLLQVASQVSPHNRFGVVQFPLNMFEPGPWCEKNSLNCTTSSMELAKTAGLFTFGIRPLDAVAQNRVLFRHVLPRLESEPMDSFMKKLKTVLDDTIHLEQTYLGRDPNNKLLVEGHIPPPEQVSWAHILINQSQSIDYFQFVEVVKAQIIRTICQQTPVLMKVEGVQDWSRQYLHQVTVLLNMWEQLLARNRRFDLERYEQLLTNRFPFLDKYSNLQQKVFHVLLSTDVDCVLVGANKLHYLDDVLQVFEVFSKDGDAGSGGGVDQVDPVFSWANQQATFLANKLKPPS